MFNYGSREIIKLVIQALHQRSSQRLRFLISNHMSDEENIVKVTQFREHSPVSYPVLCISNLTQPNVQSCSFLCRCVVVLLNPKKNRQNHIITSR